MISKIEKYWLKRLGTKYLSDFEKKMIESYFSIGHDPFHILSNVKYEKGKLYNSDCCCPSNEKYNASALLPKSSYYRKGNVIILDGIPLGFIKGRGEKSFLSWTNVYNPQTNNFPLVFGGIYSLEMEIAKEKIKIPNNNNNEWRIVHVNELNVVPKRFIKEIYSSGVDMVNIHKSMRMERDALRDFSYNGKDTAALTPYGLEKNLL